MNHTQSTLKADIFLLLSHSKPFKAMRMLVFHRICIFVCKESNTVSVQRSLRYDSTLISKR